MTNVKILLSVAAAAVLALNGCGGGGGSSSGLGGSTSSSGGTTSSSGGTTSSSGGTTSSSGGSIVIPKQEIISGDVTSDRTLTADKVWNIQGKVVVKNNATLTIEKGTILIGDNVTKGWIEVLPGSKLNAIGTASEPILFTSAQALAGQEEAPGQWGGVTLIGNAGNAQTTPYEVDGEVAGTGSDADSSGTLKYLIINNSGVEVVIDKEINGLSLVGVGSGTVVEHITVNRSSDDGVEVWGGSVNVKDVVVNDSQDDSFDTDQGWTGSIDGLMISGGLKSGIEMSGTTNALYKNVTIVAGANNAEEGAINFKPSANEVIGGRFENMNIVYSSANAVDGAFRTVQKTGSSIDPDTSFTNVHLGGTNTLDFSGPEAVALEALVNADLQPLSIVSKTSNITADETWTSDKMYKVVNKIQVTSPATLTIEPGTIVFGDEANKGWLEVLPGAKLNAAGTDTKKILFTSEKALTGVAEAAGQWGGVTLIGNAGNAQTTPYEVDGEVAGTGSDADSSGTLTNLIINNSGVEVVIDKEINGLSLVGVGSGTTVENITTNRSSDDGVEIWGGTVIVKNLTITDSGDDSFDTDQGWTGSVDGLYITGGLKSGIEMSGTTNALYKNATVIVGFNNAEEGGVNFKPSSNETIGGRFENMDMIYSSTNAVDGAFRTTSKTGSSIDAGTSFTNVTIGGTNTLDFSGPEAQTVESLFDLGTGNRK
ncbi:MAG: hypothetical protein B7X80_09595 [Sulfurovum sp. 17-42-90]|nr:MAG: hypothetical protein B7X80_09595 [Sulfurovum sp. 17-42-90]